MSLECELIPFASALIQQQAVNAVMKCNDDTEPFGLVLTEEQAVELVETRSFALKSNGRIEFGGGVIDKMLKAFCDSPYLSMRNYTQSIHALIEIFYYYKNETLDLISDDELIGFMKSAFDGSCQGSLDLLAGRELYQMARNLRFGSSAGDSGDGDSEVEEENADEE